MNGSMIWRTVCIMPNVSLGSWNTNIKDQKGHGVKVLIFGDHQDLLRGDHRNWPTVNMADPSAWRALICVLAFWFIPASLRPHLSPAEHPSHENREFWLNNSGSATPLPSPALLTSSLFPVSWPWWIGFVPVSGPIALHPQASISALSLWQQWFHGWAHW